MKLTSWPIVCAGLIVLTALTGCGEKAEAPVDEGVVRVDNTVPTAPCRITVLNGSRERHSLHTLRLVLDNGTILLDADVPGGSRRMPPIWRCFHADVAGRILSVTIDGKTRDVQVRKDTVEIVIGASGPVPAENTIDELSQRMQWR